MQLHAVCSSETVIRWGTRAIIPRISGRSGKRFVLPIRPRPRARSVPRCFGFWPMQDLTWVTRSLVSTLASALVARRTGTSAPFSGYSPEAAALLISAEHAFWSHLLGGEPAKARPVVGAAQAAQAVDGGMGNVYGVRGPEGLRDHVTDAGHLEDGTSRATSYQAGAGGCRLQHDPARAGVTDDGMDDRRAREGHVEHVLAGLFDPFLHSQAGFLRLAVAEADPAVAVAYHHQGREREAPSTFDDLRHAVDLDRALFVLRLGHYSSNPALRAASASAATLPWYRDPPRSNTTLVTPCAFARVAMSLPISLAAAMLPVAPERCSASRVEAATRVRPSVSSMIWAAMCLFERNTVSRGLSAVPITCLR